MKALAGKKTYIAAVLLAVVGIYVGVVVDPSIGVAIFLSAASIAGLGDRMNRYQQELLDALDAVRKVALEKKALTEAEHARLVADAVSVATSVTRSPAGSGAPRG